MTLKELYAAADGSYEQALSVMRVDKLIDKYIRKFPAGGIVDALIAAGKTGDPVQMFDAAHAMKGVCSNLGLTGLAAIASELSEEYRPGKPRTMSDEQVAKEIARAQELYHKAADAIALYVQSQNGI